MHNLFAAIARLENSAQVSLFLTVNELALPVSAQFGHANLLVGLAQVCAGFSLSAMVQYLLPFSQVVLLELVRSSFERQV
jgi:hypothetical protein